MASENPNTVLENNDDDIKTEILPIKAAQKPDLGSNMRAMKRNFSRYMTKLGAHIAHIGSFFTHNVMRLCDKIAQKMSAVVLPPVRRVANGVRNFRVNSKAFFRNTDEYFYRLGDAVADTKVNKGFFRAVALFFSTTGRSVWRGRRGFVVAFNWVAPVVSIAFFVGVVSYVGSLQYGVSVECNGQKLGVVSEEGVYDAAAKAFQDRISYVDGNEKVVITPRLSVQLVASTADIVKPNELVDKMITTSDAKLTQGYGVYVDGALMGVVTDRAPIDNTLSGILASYNTEGVKEVSFKEEVVYDQGLYLADSLVEPTQVVSRLTAKNVGESFYTIQAGDTPIKIASANGIGLDELQALNPSIQEECQVGNTVLVSTSEPVMTVNVTKDITYTQPIKYTTEKIDNNTIAKGLELTAVQGSNGEESIQAEVTMVNGYEVSRTIISKETTKKPVTEKIFLGTKATQAKPSGVTIIGTGSYAWPAAGGYLNQSYHRGHKGIDIAGTPKGTSIFAAEAGVVIYSQMDSGGYGNCIKIQHADGNVTLYGHQSALIAKVGQKVAKGELIGLVGNTGRSQGNHLHFEVIRNGMYYDPTQFVSR